MATRSSNSSNQSPTFNVPNWARIVLFLAVFYAGFAEATSPKHEQFWNSLNEESR